MARFCGNCGAQAEDNAKVCGYCGTTLTDNGGVQKTNTNATPMSSEKQKKMFKLVAAAAVVLVALIIVINIISGFVGSKGAARKVMNAYRDYDIDTLLEMTSDFCYVAADVWGASLEDSYENRLDNKFEYFEDRVGHDYKLKYKITDSYKLPDYRTDDLYDEMAELDDFDIGIVSKVMVIEIEVTAKGKSIDRSETWEMILTKEDGKWKLLELTDN